MASPGRRGAHSRSKSRRRRLLIAGGLGLVSALLLAAFAAVSGVLSDPAYVTYTLTPNAPSPGLLTVDVTVEGANVPFQDFYFREPVHRGQARVKHREFGVGGRGTGMPSVMFGLGSVGVIRVFTGTSRRVSGRIVIDPTWYPGDSSARPRSTLFEGGGYVRLGTSLPVPLSLGLTPARRWRRTTVASTRFILPPGWNALVPGDRVLGSLPLAEATNIYVPLGRCGVVQFERAGVLVKAMVSPEVQDPGRCLGWIESLVSAAFRLWGPPPSAPAEVCIGVFPDSRIDGGAAGAECTLVADDSPHTLAHELCHWWGPYAGRDSAWFSEGCTDYLTVELMREAGFSASEAAAPILRPHPSAAIPPGTRLDVIRLPRWDRRVYTAGVALCSWLDGELRGHSSSLAGLRGEARRATGSSRVPTSRDIMALVRSMAGTETALSLQAMLEGRQPLPRLRL